MTVYIANLKIAKTYHLYESCPNLPRSMVSTFCGSSDYEGYDLDWLKKHNFNLKLCKTCELNLKLHKICEQRRKNETRSNTKSNI